ncbi:hypothetical protein [Aliikangiella sp. G2MR2-5]|uniref:hypothetical protein n=1 Tax=Aliikangiella sp. G2MR2-5 TaxID=2788943 RepID=UPI0018A92D47|nr:hypothetical protein [Aliikangiella sp. G2MR2-5]
MPLVKSLFCIKGYDNGRRYLAISLACYLLFLMLSSVLAKAPVLLILLLVIASPVILASSMRRIHDAGLATPLAGIPLMVYWLAVFAITYVEHGAIWLLLIVSLLVTLGLALLKDPRQRGPSQYVMGYSGPIAIQSSESVAPQNFERIEPTLAGHHHEDVQDKAQIENNAKTEERAPVADLFQSVESETPLAAERPHSPQKQFERESHRGYSRSHKGSGWEAALQKWLQENRRIALVALSILSIIIVGIIGFSLLPEDTEKNLDKGTQSKPLPVARERLNKVEMPDNFWVMHDQYDALTIAWQGELKDDGFLWSALTAEGDNSCVEIIFSRQVRFRALQVSVKNGGDYYADFSPVDSKELIEAIAKLSQFKLCGYEFSLKGTQAKLMVNKKYSDYLMSDE